MKIILFGKNGQLGRELQRTLAPFGELVAVGRQELDLCDLNALKAFIRLHKPQVIVNASAYTAVDRAEQEPELAFQINSRAPELMAELAKEFHAALIHFSTDYVFDGTLGRPYVEPDIPNPLNVYGKSKLAGEQAIQKVGGAYLILRTSWVYSMSGDNFVTKVLGLARQNETIRIVYDQIGNPTWAHTLAETTALLMACGGNNFVPWLAERRALYHLAADRYASRFDWARKILELDPRQDEQICKEILPALTSDFPTTAERPQFSALKCTLFQDVFGLSMPWWQDELRLMMENS